MKKIITLGAVALSMALTGCSDYLDINQDPQSPSEANMSERILFPGAEMAFANSYGDYFRITGGYFAQQYSQNFGTSNYLDYSKFEQSAVRSSSTYSNLCVRCLQNMNTVLSIASRDGNWGNYLAGTVIRVAAYEAMVDAYGEIPYSEALDVTNVTPHYDNGQDVYTGLVAELDKALGKVTGSEPICTNFLFPGETASAWVKAANALKLRLLMRMSNAVDVKSQLQELISQDNFPAGDVAWTDCWANSSGQANPYFQEEFATYFGSTQQNVILNVALYAVLSGADDPRLEAFFTPNGSGKYTGGVSGTNFSTTASYKANYWCRPNMKYNSPVYLITRSEVEFFLAEYEVRYGSKTEAENHYKAAIEASFATAGVSASTATVLNAWPWDANNWQKCIGVQKWVALSGVNNYEAWCEMRRLGYPAFGTVTGADIYNELTDAYNPSTLTPGDLYTPIKYNTSLGANKVLQRWPYPEASSNRNQNVPSYPGDAAPVFWAK